MTSYVQARDTLVGKINAALSTDHPALPVFWENTLEVDVNSVGNVFLQVEINFQDEVDTTIDPETITTGEVNFRLFYKQGQGVRAGLTVFDYLRNLMKFQVVSGVTLYTPKPGKKEMRNGWSISDLNAPFSFRSA